MSLPSIAAAAVSLAAQRHGLEPAVLAALVWKESSGDPHAIRYEPHYRWLWDVRGWQPFRRLSAEEAGLSHPPADFAALDGVSAATEWAAQRTSWGLCQVMGAVARERGFHGQFLSELCEPEVGIEYGARHFALLLAKYDVLNALSAYNAGRPTETNEETYVRPILRQAAVYRREGY